MPAEKATINKIAHSLLMNTIDGHRERIDNLELQIVRLQFVRFKLLQKPKNSFLIMESLSRREMNGYHQIDTLNSRIDLLRDWCSHIAASHIIPEVTID